MNRVLIGCIDKTCPGHLGYCTPTHFYPVGSHVAITSRVLVECPVCKKKRAWRPAQLDRQKASR